jgi:hypothetical protein
MKIFAQPSGKATQAGLILIATEMIKLGYTVSLKHEKIDGNSKQVVEAE